MNSSNQWNALTLSFHVVGNFLAWRVGSGSQVCIGVNAIAGCGQSILPTKNTNPLFRGVRKVHLE
jgi:hypothetical protein